MQTILQHGAAAKHKSKYRETKCKMQVVGTGLLYCVGLGKQYMEKYNAMQCYARPPRGREVIGSHTEAQRSPC